MENPELIESSLGLPQGLSIALFDKMGTPHPGWSYSSMFTLKICSFQLILKKKKTHNWIIKWSSLRYFFLNIFLRRLTAARCAMVISVVIFSILGIIMFHGCSVKTVEVKRGGPPWVIDSTELNKTKKKSGCGISNRSNQVFWSIEIFIAISCSSRSIAWWNRFQDDGDETKSPQLIQAAVARFLAHGFCWEMIGKWWVNDGLTLVDPGKWWVNPGEPWLTLVNDGWTLVNPGKWWVNPG